MREIIPEIHEAGAELVIIGNGTSQFAQFFVEDFEWEGPVFTDPGRGLYAAIGARRAGWLDLFKPRLWLNTLRARRAGHRQVQVLGDPRQNGGVFVVLPSGEVAYRYVSSVAGDHPEPPEVLAALRLALEGANGG